MEIIKKADETPIETTCSICGCVFKFNPITDPIRVSTGVVRFIKRKRYILYCPNCGWFGIHYSCVGKKNKAFPSPYI